MLERGCTEESAIRRMAVLGEDDPALRQHAATCELCREVLVVAQWMQSLGGLPVEPATGHDARELWWRAELLRRWEAERRVNAASEVGERLAVAVGVLGSVLLIALPWRRLMMALAATRRPDPTLLLGLALFSVVLVAITAAFAAWDSPSAN